ncbi:DNA polymerase/3'-5' exonuclease PolX [Patescibacteria group bacterium]
MEKTNQEISQVLYEMAERLEMLDVAFKPRAFERAANSVESFDHSINDLYKKQGKKALLEIPGVGEGIAERIEEYISTGKIKDLEKLKKKMPVNITELSLVEGVGPKIIKTLYRKLRIKNLKDLEKAAHSGKLKKLPRFGEKLEKKILKGIEFQKSSAGRIPLGTALPYARAIMERIKKSGLVEKISLAGSIIRWKETVGDIDILVVSKHPQKLSDLFVKMPEVKAVLAKGDTKTMVRLNIGVDADLRIISKKSFGSALQYFAGDKNHNVAVRKLAMKKGYKLNEYGLYKGKKQIAGANEKEIYKKLGMDWIPHEMRRNNGEIEIARAHKIPRLVELKDIKGDLQIQTSWTDGEHSILEMAKEAMRLGLEYIVITDHTRDLAMTGGSDEKKLLKQMKEIDKLNRKLKMRKFRILKGAEVNIRKDGSLDIKDEVLAKLDVVGAAVHSNFNLSKKEQTERVIRAMENPHMDILFHPTGRLIQKREAIDLDIDAVLKTAKKTNTVLEINAHPMRLDLKDEHIKRAVELGVKLEISTDAHSMSDMSLMEYGVHQARRGWAKKPDIVNARPLEEFLKLLK